MKAKYINEDINNILKEPISKINFINKLPDIKKNNERVKYLFSGNINDVLNLSEYFSEFANSILKEIKEKYLIFFDLAKFTNNNDLLNFLNALLKPTYYDPIKQDFQSERSDFEILKDKLYFRKKQDAAKFLNLKYFDICKEYLNNLNIRMTDPKIETSGIVCSLDNKIDENQADKLNSLLEEKLNFGIYRTKGGNENLYPCKRA